MFNNLNNQSPIKPPVDDIFAETDKTSEGINSAGSEIETHRAGLASTSEIAEEPIAKKGLGKSFKIILILIVVTILVLSGYLVYSKFFASPVEETIKQLEPNGLVNNTASSTPSPTSTVVDLVPEVPTSTPEILDLIASSTPLATTSTTTIVTIPVDSDSDGLTDAEEQLAGTNSNVIDTDIDGLSDYEEVRIYRTSPINPDTDGDTYLDGAEVKGGYNPNGPGKMLGNN